MTTGLNRRSAVALPFLLLLLTLFIPSTGAFAKKESATTRLEIPVGNFHSIKAATGIEVIFKQGPATGKALVQTTPTGARYLKVQVNGKGELSLFYEGTKGNVSIGQTIVTLTAPSLTGIDLSSAASLTVNGPLSEQRKVDIELSSASSVVMETLNTPELDADLSSSASLRVKTLNGDLEIEASSASSVSIERVSCDKSDIDASSAATVTIGQLVGNHCEAEASSGSKVTINGLECLYVKGGASSGANVTIKGKCGSIATESSSGGRVDISGLSENKQLAQKAISGLSAKSTKSSKSTKSTKSERKSKSPNFRIP